MNGRAPLARAGRAAGIVALLVFSLFPAYWMFTTAIDADAATRGSSLFPADLTWAHFDRVLDQGGFAVYIRNSVLVATGTVLVSALVALLAAVAVARFEFSLRKAMLVMILVVQMVPLEALVIPLFLQARDLQMLNSLLGLVIVYLAFSLPFAVWTLRGFVAAVPKEIEEAAYVDGASWGRMFRSVLLPLVAPGLVATSVFAFITAWNEFIFALTFMQDSDRYTVAIGLQKFFGQNTADWGAVMAASTLITLPVVVFFTLVQRNLSSGLAAGAVKG
ncbi:carbohydrate ABC transporter permease [Georgenia muralis]|uniref:Carbohydrate ABC transporter membrane protein 2 (CUT1 family) n=1 Tax=Georgenia muralis TaxID=154117 RepID=A0A3N4Z374_9MICO|nr:carbohydrate ABC transporter permease [Georgenia muralis]RPF27729.1 carbohydrate ABC transporter membrane protein 2 (CUT1 family) [Georgenia muralis]